MNHTKEPWYKHKGNTGIIYGNDGMSIAAGRNNDILLQEIFSLRES